MEEAAAAATAALSSPPPPPLPAASAMLAEVRRPLCLAAETVRPMPRHMPRVTVAVIAYFVFVMFICCACVVVMEMGWFTAHVFDAALVQGSILVLHKHFIFSDFLK